MADVLSRKQRSYCMSQIKGKDTLPEMTLRGILRQAGIRGIRTNHEIIGKPDFVLPGLRMAVFIDGCFWHKCRKCFIQPATNASFWQSKINSNVKRDRIVNRELRKNGWRVLRIWEHELKNQKLIRNRILDRINDAKKEI